MTNMFLSWQPNPTSLTRYQEKVILRITLDGADYFIQGKVNCYNFDGSPQNYTVRITMGDEAAELDRIDLLSLPYDLGQTVVLETWADWVPGWHSCRFEMRDLPGSGI